MTYPLLAYEDEAFVAGPDGRPIRMLAESGEMAILLVEQYYDFAESLADQYLLMERGEFIMRGRGEAMPQDGVREALAV